VPLSLHLPHISHVHPIRWQPVMACRRHKTSNWRRRRRVRSLPWDDIADKLHCEIEEFEECCESSALLSRKFAVKTMPCSCGFCSFCSFFNVSESKSGDNIRRFQLLSTKD
jgi:hypothetical protein